MNLNPMPYLRNVGAALGGGRKFTNSGGDLARIVRLGDPMGMWSGQLGFEPRVVNPHLYEALREAIPILDGAIAAMVTLDGIIRVEGDNDKLVAEIEDWMTNVPVNDAEKGLQALYESQGNERYEQGFGIAEWTTDRRGRDIVGLRVADSKGVYFRRDGSGLQVFYRPPGKQQTRQNATDNIERLLRNGLCETTVDVGTLQSWGYTQLDRKRLLYTVNAPDADNPYGTSVLRSLEFTGQSLLVIQNALQRVWARWGDPPLLAIYHVANKAIANNTTELNKRRDEIAKHLKAMMDEKGRGNSVDLVQAIGKDDDIKIEIVGANGVALEIEAPARHLLEQIVAKVGLPAWMLGLQFSTSERLAEQQSGMALQGSKTRFVRRAPDLHHLVATMLRMRGRTWKPGDWKLTQELPNIQDQVKAAQAGFLIAQTRMMESGAAANDAARGIDNNLRASRGDRRKAGRKDDDEGEGRDHDHAIGEDWAEDDPALPQMERAHGDQLLALWAVLAAAVFRALRLKPEAVDDWRFDFDMLPAVTAAGDAFQASATGPSAPLVLATTGAWRRGLANAAAQIPDAQAVLNITEAVIAQLRANAVGAVATTFARTYRDDILNVMVAGVYDGLSESVVATQLRKLFKDHEHDWLRLVASEMAAAHGAAKEQQYLANGVPLYDWTTAGDGSVCPICRGHRENGPYTVGAGPLPMRDSHPLCRCSTVPRLPD